MDGRQHWEKVYQTKSADQMSWFQEHAARSLEIIRSIGGKPESRIIDVGGGASTARHPVDVGDPTLIGQLRGGGEGLQSLHHRHPETDGR